MVMLTIALFENTRFELDKLMPLIAKTITIMIASMVIEAKAIAIVIKNVFKTRCSFDLQATTIEKKIIDNVDCVFTSDIEETVKKKICSELIKFVKGSYQRQLFDNFDFKILVKDTTLANGIKEQAERHLFTLNNSRIFKQES